MIAKFNVWDFKQRLINVINKKKALRKNWKIIIQIIHIRIKHNYAKYE